MAKTRSKYLRPTIKKEECDDKIKIEKELLHSTNTVPKTKNKITKSRKSVQIQVKSEDADDSKVLLTLPKKTFSRQKITAEQIEKLIGYVVNDKMSVLAASKKAGINKTSAHKYYQEYQNDPEHKIPVPKTHLGNSPSTTLTQQKLDKLIRYIVDDGMNVAQASKKVDMDRNTAAKYYAKYLEDPEQKMPLLSARACNSSKRCTQEEIADLIGYIVNDNMSLMAASKKSNLSESTARRYYLQYLHDPTHKIPDPCEPQLRSGKPCTNNQVKSLIGYIVDGKLSLFEASVKSNMSINAATKYYQQYLNDPEKKIPTPETNNSRLPHSPPTMDQVKIFFRSVIVDKLSVAQAAGKAEMAKASGQRYYDKYLKDPNNQTKIKDMTYSADKMKRLVTLVQKEKLSVAAAAAVVHLNVRTAGEYYQKYLKNPQYEFPEKKYRHYTQECLKKFIGYIEHDKMTVKSAARKINMNLTTASRYYKEYKNDPEHRIPVPTIQGHARKNKTLDKYAQIIADIYKNNTDSDSSDLEIKVELMEEDTKLALKA